MAQRPHSLLAFAAFVVSVSLSTAVLTGPGAQAADTPPQVATLTLVPESTPSRPTHLAPRLRAARPSLKVPGRHLIVRLAQVPSGSRPRVTITGPRGYKRVVTRTQTLAGLRPGIYRISANTVPAGALTAAGVALRPIVRVTKRRGATSTVSYYTRIPATTKAPSASTLRTVTTDQTGSISTVTLLDDSLAVGDVLALGVSPQTPAGLLSKVVAKDASNGQATYTVQQASLQDAFPQGKFSVTVSTLGPSTRALAGDKTSGKSPLSCTSGGDGGTLDTVATADITFTFSPEWNGGDVAMTLSSAASAGVTSTLTVSANASCKLPLTPLGVPVTLPTIEFMIGPVPIVIVPVLTFGVEGSASAQAQLTAGASVSATTSASLRVTASGDVDPSFQPPSVTGEPIAKLTGSAAAQAMLSAKLTGNLYGVAGPYVRAAVGPKVVADINTDPWWSLTGQLNVGAGLTLDRCVTIFWKDLCARLAGGKDDIVTHQWPIAKAKGPFSAGAQPLPESNPTVSASAEPPLAVQKAAAKQYPYYDENMWKHHDCWGWKYNPPTAGRVGNWSVTYLQAKVTTSCEWMGADFGIVVEQAPDGRWRTYMSYFSPYEFPGEKFIYLRV